MEQNTCKECEQYHFLIKEQRRRDIFRMIKFIAVLVFAGGLSVAFQSYIPCLFLLLLLL